MLTAIYLYIAGKVKITKTVASISTTSWMTVYNFKLDNNALHTLFQGLQYRHSYIHEIFLSLNVPTDN